MICGAKRRILLWLCSALLLLSSLPSYAQPGYDGPALPEGWYPISETELSALEELSMRQTNELKTLETALKTAETQLNEAERATNDLSLLIGRLRTSLNQCETVGRMWRIGTITATSVAAVGWLLYFLKP